MRSTRNLLNVARLAFARAARTQGSRAFAAGAARQASMNFGRTAAVVAGVAAGASYFVYEQQQLSAAAPKKEAPKIIIAGAPGSGKGTQCEFIVKKYGVVHISTGDILREQVKNGTDLGKEAKEYMSKGALVPDSVVIGMVKAKLSEPEVKSKGWLLDGFPRTAAQAKAMADLGITADVFLQLEVPDSVLVERICLRRTDPVTGQIYHLKFNPPPADIVSRLQHRSDDNESSLKERLKQCDFPLF
jgi:adenylate kinase